MENTFLCLLPTKEDSVRLGEKLNVVFSLQVFPQIKLPLHLTLFYFPTIPHNAKDQAINWLHVTAQENQGGINANTSDIACFRKDDQDFVYYLPIASKRIFLLHKELHGIFKNTYEDAFEFIPHLSLFYPQKNLNENEKKAARKIFEGFGNIAFDQLALASEKNGGIHYLDIQTL
jgi:2'-5' RNA ligase